MQPASYQAVQSLEKNAGFFGISLSNEMTATRQFVRVEEAGVVLLSNKDPNGPQAEM